MCIKHTKCQMPSNHSQPEWQHSKACMCGLRNIAMCDYEECVTTGQTHTRTDREMPDKVIPMWCYASQATQKGHENHHTSVKTKI